MSSRRCHACENANSSGTDNLHWYGTARIRPAVTQEPIEVVAEGPQRPVAPDHAVVLDPGETARLFDFNGRERRIGLLGFRHAWTGALFRTIIIRRRRIGLGGYWRRRLIFILNRDVVF